MNFFSRIAGLFDRAPKEQITGYSLSELQAVFTEPLKHTTPALPLPLRAVSLEGTGVPAYYGALLIDGSDRDSFQALIESSFTLADERSFNDLPVRQYENLQHHQHLICFISTREFNAVTVRLVTNSTDFLEAIQRQRFAVPPPWIAFEGYDPAWWGTQLQGAQGYYNDQYFLPFFTGLGETEKRAYFARYTASQAWAASLMSIGDE
ncbi:MULTISPECIES: hypothetical protein [Pseudomonas]|uniref:hypothetical protein n=1 Tax=Pseudomonas TaxID=286 RepID=UPI000F495329|nr:MULTISPECIES: hypothetical protein [Pseudomonas]ROL84814.1 hypothetical protein BK636_05905 [Pseudomonas chlororaphis]WDG54064.1 hypothetical protein PUP76_30060 [Pseudomonas chlororaphis]WDH90746.1 hypothetical protein PUP74_12195 [Pseudomonas chlororaphis]WPO49380.1 hypothetical protein SHB59_10060 [Pseudomonas sp. S1Bt23]